MLAKRALKIRIPAHLHQWLHYNAVDNSAPANSIVEAIIDNFPDPGDEDEVTYRVTSVRLPYESIDKLDRVAAHYTTSRNSALTIVLGWAKRQAENAAAEKAKEAQINGRQDQLPR